MLKVDDAPTSCANVLEDKNKQDQTSVLADSTLEDLERRRLELIGTKSTPPAADDDMITLPMASSTPVADAAVTTTTMNTSTSSTKTPSIRKQLQSCKEKLLECHIKEWQRLNRERYTPLQRTIKYIPIPLSYNDTTISPTPKKQKKIDKRVRKRKAPDRYQ